VTVKNLDRSLSFYRTLLPGWEIRPKGTGVFLCYSITATASCSQFVVKIFFPSGET
jgi:hypothetical protein